MNLFQNILQFQHCASILNDESGSGKCFQCTALFDAILKNDDSIGILIICHRKQSLEHWKFHLDCFLENISSNIADNQCDTQLDSSSNGICIASVDYVLNHFSTFKAKKFDILVFQDQRLECSVQVIRQLKEIQASHKIALCSDDLMVSVGVNECVKIMMTS